MSWWPSEALDRQRWGAMVEPVLRRVQRALDAGRFPHALLLAGPERLGRELAAVETAVMLSCEGAGAPWSEGSGCDRVRAGLHPDVVAVFPEGASHRIKIEQIRDVVESAPSRPYEGRRRVWILDGVEAARFMPQAANAFLKVLEEPPDHVRFLLLASNPWSVLPTIRSRCQQLSLPGPTAVAQKLGVEASPGLAPTALTGRGVEPVVQDVRRALDSALAGEIVELLRLPHRVPDGLPVAEIVAAVALDQAAETEDGDRAWELARLAADLMASERRVRVLNLTKDRQLVSALLRWYDDLPKAG